MKVNNYLPSFVIGALLLLSSHTAAVNIGFGELDYSENESTGRARVVLTKINDNTEPVSITVSSMTYDEFLESGRSLAPEFSDIPTRAQYDSSPSGRRDFEKVSETVTFPPSSGLEELEVFIPIVDDSINEATESFVVLAALSESTTESNDEILFTRGGVTMVNIVDDDPIKVGFERPEYSVSEDDGTVEDTVYLTKGDTESEVNISVVIENSPNAVAVEGADYNFDDPLVVLFQPDQDRIPIPVTIFQDDIAEDREQFQLFLALRDPIRGQSPGLSTTNIIIEDDDIAVVNFTQPEYVVNEGDGSVEVCIQIAEPEEVDLFLFGNIVSEDETAKAGEDFDSVNQFFNLYNGNTEHCFDVPIIDDPEREPNETLVIQLLPDTSFLPPNVRFTMPNVTITIVDNDQPEIVPTEPAEVVSTKPEVVPSTEPEVVPSTEPEVLPTEPETIDECALNIHECSQFADCVDTADGYQCNCLPGFAGDGFSCLDINECCEELHDCDSNARCQNTVGSYVCTCKPGFTGDGKACRDIDECADSRANTCSSDAHCFNVPGYHFCVCKAGYTGNGKECTLIIEPPQRIREPAAIEPNRDECSPATESKDCHRRATCEKGSDGYHCVCKEGFEGDGKRTSRGCRDINECSKGLCPSEARCRNRLGSYTCTCPRGTELSGNSCVEIGRNPPQFNPPEVDESRSRSRSRSTYTRTRSTTYTRSTRRSRRDVV